MQRARLNVHTLLHDFYKLYGKQASRNVFDRLAGSKDRDWSVKHNEPSGTPYYSGKLTSQHARNLLNTLRPVMDDMQSSYLFEPNG